MPRLKRVSQYLNTLNGKWYLSFDGPSADGHYKCLMGSLIVDYFGDGTLMKYFKDDENKRNSQ